jgi:hypothetical protein
MPDWSDKKNVTIILTYHGDESLIVRMKWEQENIVMCMCATIDRGLYW